MKNLFMFIMPLTSAVCIAQPIDSTRVYDERLSKLECFHQQDSLEKQGLCNQINSLNSDIGKLSYKVSSQEIKLKRIQQVLDSLNATQKCLSKSQGELKMAQDADRITFNNGIEEAETKISRNRDGIRNSALIGGVIVLSCIVILIIYLRRRKKSDIGTIDEVVKAQAVLRAAQERMQEDSIKLDNQMLSLIQKQISTVTNTSSTITDHSLVLKVADEIVRIELNLSRMDSSIKGYKQLSKALERIRDNFSANGYEIADMLGKTYVQGMRAAVTFVTDETLEPGKQVISKIIKPQVNYNDEMIQAAQIEVSQSE